MALVGMVLDVAFGLGGFVFRLAGSLLLRVLIVAGAGFLVYLGWGWVQQHYSP